MMMRKMGRRRRSGRKTSPCSPSSARRLEVTSKTRPTRHTASSMIGGWRVSTHCDDNTTQHWTCTHIQKSFHIQPLAQMWRNTWCLDHQSAPVFLFVCLCFLNIKGMLKTVFVPFVLKIFTILLKEARKHFWQVLQSLITILPSTGYMAKYIATSHDP